MASLHPTMDKAALDLFLRAGFGVESNPWEVEEIFKFARNPAAWAPVERVFKLAGGRTLHDYPLQPRTRPEMVIMSLPLVLGSTVRFVR